MPLVLGVASLAAATRVELRDADDGRLLASGTVRRAAASGATFEQFVETWWTGVVDAIAAAGLRAGAADVAGLAVAAARGALVLVDAVGAPLGPASLPTDPRAARAADELVARLGADQLARATGQRPAADTPLARLVWLLGIEPALADRIDGVLGAADALTARLTGRRVTDRAGASATGWWDPVGERWRPDLLDRVAKPAPTGGWAATLPAVLAPGDAADWVSANIHGLLRLRGRPLVAAGTIDVAAHALAAAVGPGTAAALLDDDEAAVVAGTVTPVADPRGRIVGLADAAGHHLPTIGIAPIGQMLDGVARLIGADAAGLATRAALTAREQGWRPPTVVVLPARPGGSTARPAGRPGAVLGLDGGTTSGELAWAALLGAGVEVLDALAALDDVGGGEPEGGRLVLAGPVARRPGVAAAVAELAGREVVVARHGVATGACVQAAAALHGSNPLEVARAWSLDDGDVIEPAGAVDADECLAAHAAARDVIAPPDAGAHLA